MRRPKRVPFRMLRQDLLIFTDQESWGRFLRRYPLPDGQGLQPNCEAATWSPTVGPGEQSFVAVFVPVGLMDRVPVAGVVDTVAHEAVHAVDQLMNNIGETEATHEVHAYLTGNIAGHIWQELSLAHSSLVVSS